MDGMRSVAVIDERQAAAAALQLAPRLFNLGQ